MLDSVVQETTKVIRSFGHQFKEMNICKRASVEVGAVAAAVFIGMGLRPYVASATLKTVIIGPAIEEVLFRGLLQPGIGLIQKGLNLGTFGLVPPSNAPVQKVIRVALTALIFAVCHLTNPLPSLIQVSVCFIDGIAHGIIREETGSIIPGIFFHALHNGTITAVVALAKSQVFVTVLACSPILIPLAVMVTHQKISRQLAPNFFSSCCYGPNLQTDPVKSN